MDQRISEAIITAVAVDEDKATTKRLAALRTKFIYQLKRFLEECPDDLTIDDVRREIHLLYVNLGYAKP